MDCKNLRERLLAGFGNWTEVRPLDSGECLVYLPFWDGSGDPITLGVSTDGRTAKIDDAGAIAACLFSLGQHEENTSAFKLVESLQHAHGLDLDFGEGVASLSVGEQDIYDGVAEMTKVILSVLTVVPHIRVARRNPRSLGPRLRSKIAREYRQMKVLDLVERHHRLDGAKVQGWPIDFHWSFGHNGRSQTVNVVAADLGVAEPLQKAERIIAMSLDTRKPRSLGSDQLRIVFESDIGNIASAEAGEFLRFHGNDLSYDVFDLGNADESLNFFNMSVDELMGQADERWTSEMVNRC